MSNLFINVPSQAANGSGAAVDFSTMGASKSIVVDGSWPETMQPTIVIEINNDPAAAAPWAPIAVFQGAGNKVVDVACHWIRATVSNFKQGTAPDIDIGGQTAVVNFATLIAPAGNGVGASVNVSALGPYKSVHVAQPFRGNLIVELSTDGATDWGQPFSTQTQGVMSGVFTANFARVRRSGVPLIDPGLPEVYLGATESAGGGGGTGVDVEDEGIPLAGNPYTTLNFIGSAIQATDAGGGTADITVTVTPGVTVQDEGVPIAGNPHSTLNFVGGGVAVADAGGGVATVAVPGAASQVGLQAFRFTATGAEGSDFMVNLPVARASDVYRVQGTKAGVALLFDIDCPDLLAADRTTTQFRVVTSGPVTAGDQIDFLVTDVV